MNWQIVVGILFIIGGIGNITKDFSDFLISIAIGSALLFWGFRKKKRKLLGKPNTYQSTADHTNRKTTIPTDSNPAPLAPSKTIDDYAHRRAAFIGKKKDEFSHALEKIPRVPFSLSDEPTKRAKLLTMPEIKYCNITRATNMDKLFPLVVVDTETTGLNPGGNDIIEISAIKYGPDFTPISCFTTLCKPRKPIPAEASEVNHITDEMVSDSPPFSLVAAAFSEYISGCNLVGHNLGFDLRFLYISGVILPPKAKYYDTLDLAKKVLTKSGGKKYNHRTGEYEEIDDWDVYDYKLDTLCEYYNVFRSDSHRSLSDCYATALLFESLIDDKTS